jgi:hypothetical protein
MPLSDFLSIMNVESGSFNTSYLLPLGQAFDRNSTIGYQYSDSLPAFIPPSPKPAMRIMWGGLGWLLDLPDNERTDVENRILRLRCDGNYGTCIYLIKDADGFEINFPGRGVLLSEPLNPEEHFPWWGK